MSNQRSTQSQSRNPLCEFLGPWHSSIERDLLEHSRDAIAEQLRRSGIVFEGKKWPMSLVPTALSGSELGGVSQQAGLIRSALCRIIDAFIREHARGERDGPLHRWFAPVARWWDLIAAEHRATEPIQLMRYDAIREDSGRWGLLENNTCCPGGTINCALFRGAWLTSPLGREVTRAMRVIEFPIDRPESFVRHLVRIAKAVTDDPAPNLAICSYRGLYKNELASLASQHRAMVERGEIAGGELLLCDASDVKCDGGPAYVHGKQIAVLYNKIDQLMIDPAATELEGWVRAVSSDRVEFVNSVGAMFLTEAKRALALLCDPIARGTLALDEPTIAAIASMVPLSHVLAPWECGRGTVAQDALLASLRSERERYVLKADMLTRGEGIYLGRQQSELEWEHSIASTMEHHGIVQECVDTPRRGVPNEEDEYFGIDLFFFGGDFAGAVSRSHTDMVFNLGRGGRESPVLVLD